MTKIVYEILIKYGEITPEIFRDYLLELHKKYNVFEGDVYGPSTQKAVEKILKGENIYEMGKTGITCGSAMRSLPIAMYFYNDFDALIKNTVASCIISHNTDVAIDAAIACNVTLAGLINGKDKFSAIEEGIRITKENHGKFGERTNEPKIHEKIQMAVDLLKGKTIDEAMYIIPEKIGVSWFARDTIPAAFANYIVSNTPQESSLLAMRCGGDNQTVPAIACSFMGAEKGPRIFPRKILRKIEEVNKININEMVDKLLEKMGSKCI
jgi:ADP-ribosylglycohydrolase